MKSIQLKNVLKTCRLKTCHEIQAQKDFSESENRCMINVIVAGRISCLKGKRQRQAILMCLTSQQGGFQHAQRKYK